MGAHDISCHHTRFDVRKCTIDNCEMGGTSLNSCAIGRIINIVGKDVHYLQIRWNIKLIIINNIFDLFIWSLTMEYCPKYLEHSNLVPSLR